MTKFTITYAWARPHFGESGNATLTFHAKDREHAMTFWRGYCAYGDEADTKHRFVDMTVEAAQ